MDSILVQILLVLFSGGIATYDTLQSKRRKMKECPDKAGSIFNLQN